MTLAGRSLLFEQEESNNCRVLAECLCVGPFKLALRLVQLFVFSFAIFVSVSNRLVLALMI